jgi:hypothetical protein
VPKQHVLFAEFDMPLNGIDQTFSTSLHIHDMSGEDQRIASHVDAESTVPGGKEAEPENDDTEIVYSKGVELVVIIIALCLAVLLVALDQTIIATAIPRITDHFNSVQDIGWYGSVSTTDLCCSRKYSLEFASGLFFNGHFVATYIRARLQNIQCVSCLLLSQNV